MNMNRKVSFFAVNQNGAGVYLHADEIQIFRKEYERSDIFRSVFPPARRGFARFMAHLWLLKQNCFRRWNENSILHEQAGVAGFRERDPQSPEYAKFNDARNAFVLRFLRASLNDVAEKGRKFNAEPEIPRTNKINEYGMPAGLKDRFSNRWMSLGELRKAWGVEARADEPASQEEMAYYLADLSTIGAEARARFDGQPESRASIGGAESNDPNHPAYMAARESRMEHEMLQREKKIVEEHYTRMYREAVEAAIANVEEQIRKSESAEPVRKDSPSGGVPFK